MKSGSELLASFHTWLDHRLGLAEIENLAKKCEGLDTEELDQQLMQLAGQQIQQNQESYHKDFYSLQ